MFQKRLYDVVIIGGGPAGLSAALILARCVRSVLVFDTGKPRNFRAKQMNGFISRDGSDPREFLRITREQVKQYPVDFVYQEVVEAKKVSNNSFELVDADHNRYYAKKVLIATGMVDDIPEIDGIDKFYGSSVHHCPYCDGWEVRLKPLAVIGKGRSGSGLALSLTSWSDDVVLLTNGSTVTDDELQRLELKNIQIIDKPVMRLEGDHGLLERIVFVDGTSIERSAMFFTTDQYQRSNLAAQLGCDFTRKGGIKSSRFQQTSVNGVFVAGDVSKDVQLVIMAAAEGARAGVVINKALQKEEMNLKKVSDSIRLHHH
ncbi:NAD(P)/FAD-dependent oxidoreductase [Cytophagaceae bacterium ABcell3]|nr:NAD(P)/FAD-dependent oxidoreductase [Cytophagaceae bacterium ABcell3]